MIETCPMCRQSKVVDLPCPRCEKTAHKKALKERNIVIKKKTQYRDSKGRFAKCPHGKVAIMMTAGYICGICDRWVR